jgi:hypothetical protein
VAKNCVGFSAGYSETLELQPGDLVTLVKDESWVYPTPTMIATDRGAAHV